MELADVIGDRLDADQFVGFQGTLARVRLETDDLLGARAELDALLADPRDRYALADPFVARSLLAVYARYVETGDPEGGRALVAAMVDVLPPELADLRLSVLARADSAAAVADTRAKLGEGFQYYRDGQFRDALRFFQAADERTDLTVDQQLIVKELLAGTLYSLTRIEDADNVYRGVFEVDPRFDLADRRERLGQLYGVSVFTDEMVAHFLEIRPSPPTRREP
jgi:tetratricopeptide (TPR) repeat protein